MGRGRGRASQPGSQKVPFASVMKSIRGCGGRSPLKASGTRSPRGRTHGRFRHHRSTHGVSLGARLLVHVFGGYLVIMALFMLGGVAGPAWPIVLAILMAQSAASALLGARLSRTRHFHLVNNGLAAANWTAIAAIIAAVGGLMPITHRGRTGAHLTEELGPRQVCPPMRSRRPQRVNCAHRTFLEDSRGSATASVEPAAY